MQITYQYPSRTLYCSLMTTGVIPSITAIRSRASEKLGFEPCHWQAEVTRALLGGRDIVSTAVTGAGKTATFWLPMLFEKKIELIVTPLKSLGEQMASNARDLRFTAVNITRDNFNPRLIKVSS